MVLLSGMLGLAAAAGLTVVAWHTWQLQQALRESATRLQYSSRLLMELQRLQHRQSQLAEVQRLAEFTIDTGADVVRAVHESIAAIPFDVLDAVPATRDVSRVVRRTHNLISDAVYGSIKGVNKVLGGATRTVLKAPKKPSDPGGN